jgi:hypothetical protein
LFTHLVCNPLYHHNSFRRTPPCPPTITTMDRQTPNFSFSQQKQSIIGRWSHPPTHLFWKDEFVSFGCFFCFVCVYCRQVYMIQCNIAVVVVAVASSWWFSSSSSSLPIGGDGGNCNRVTPPIRLYKHRHHQSTSFTNRNQLRNRVGII